MADDESTEVELHGGWWQMMGAQKLNITEDVADDESTEVELNGRWWQMMGAQKLNFTEDGGR